MSCAATCPAPQPQPADPPAWRAHPHYPRQLLLVGGHAAFRRIGRLLIELAPSPDEQSLVRAWFDAWQRGMRGHEGYEEGKLYPYLEARYGADLSALRADHERLHSLRDAVWRALDDADAAGRSAALEAYVAELCAHLDREERVVIPMLLDLPPEVFHRYTTTSLGPLLAELEAC